MPLETVENIAKADAATVVVDFRTVLTTRAGLIAISVSLVIGAVIGHIL